MSHPKYKDIGDPVTNLIEECAELIHALSKVQRFGWDAHNPESSTKKTNYQRVEEEIADVKERMEEIRKLMNSN